MPSFTAEVMRERLVVVASEDPEYLIFFSRRVSITGVTPHSFRRTVAAVIDRAGGRS